MPSRLTGNDLFIVIFCTIYELIKEILRVISFQSFLYPGKEKPKYLQGIEM